MEKIADINVKVASQGLTLTALYKTEYNDGNIAIIADFSYEDDDPNLIGPYVEQNAISVNLPDEAYNLQEGEFFLKDWSERERLAKVLISSGVVVDTGAKVRSGYVKVPIVKLNVE